MIDNALNNEKPKEEKQTGRISIKEKLAEKKAVIKQRGKEEKEVSEKGMEKKRAVILLVRLEQVKIVCGCPFWKRKGARYEYVRSAYVGAGDFCSLDIHRQ